MFSGISLNSLTGCRSDMTTPPASIDLKRLAAEVSAQHGIRIDSDDPMMAVVTLNRLVFEQAVAQVLDRVQMAVRDFEAAAEKVQVRAGGVLAQEVRDCCAALRLEIEKAAEHPSLNGRNGHVGPDTISPAAKTRWLIIGFALALLFVGLGVWLGSMLH